ncbi:hypothetical protein GCM10017044_25780 [Kordiimonas sediminis]|uniref:Flagellar protein FliL n=1 Tax=Kordiimonas sediminis TaxID=1735581 RepID=A0A919EA55_9PROT|nr:flagellar basal body-associated FliL family protein [Kordiimonas sediminis]GHF29370.1 hypothetical protein GCM10017044_25780 [Kordiimonas sediminis]
MADTEDDVLGDDDLTEGLEKKKFSGKVILMIAGAAIVVLLALVGVISMFSGGEEEPEQQVAGVDATLDQMAEDAAASQAGEQLEQDLPPEELALLFIELDEQVYNLNTGGEGSSFLRAKIVLEVDRESYRADIEAKLPRILDELNTYMRELRPDDLDGSSGLFRLKEELLMRINQSVAPSRVKDVLFQEFLIQG